MLNWCGVFLPEASQSSNAKLGWMQAVYFLSGVRTPIGKFGGSLASLSAADMGVVAAKAAIDRAGVSHRKSKRPSLAMPAKPAGGQILLGRFRFAAASRNKLPPTPSTKPVLRE